MPLTNDNSFGVGREVDLMVYVYQRPHMRDEMLEYELQMGRGVLEGIFDRMVEMPHITDVFLSFPENHTNIIEQRVLYERLGHYCPNLKKVTIKTQSVYIIQCTRSHCVGIVKVGGPLQVESHPIDMPLWYPMTGNVIGKGLNVLYGASAECVAKKLNI